MSFILSAYATPPKLLQDFIKTVLVDIEAGVKEAAVQTKRPIYVSTYSEPSKYKGIDFDVAVTASSEALGKAGAEINVVGIQLGTKADAKISNEEVSRVKFTIVAKFDTQP